MKHNTKIITARINAQTAWHLARMAEAEGVTVGRVIDRLVIASRAARPRPEIKDVGEGR